MKKTGILVTVIMVLALAITGCGSFSNESGELALSLADAPVNDVKKVNVTLDKVQVIREEDGEEVKETINDFSDNGGTATFNLLELRFNEELLGQENLPAGKYKQIRLIVSGEGYDMQKGKPNNENTTGKDPTNLGESYVVYKDDTQKNIFIPSGQQTGLKIDHIFTIENGKLVDLVLDADVRELMHSAGASGKIILEPTAIDIVDKVVSGNVEGQVKIDGSTYTEIAENGYDIIVEAIPEGATEPAKTTVATIEKTDSKDPGSYLIRGLERDKEYKINVKVYNPDKEIIAGSNNKTGVTIEAGETNQIKNITVSVSY
jgi:hypothetical protein